MIFLGQLEDHTKILVDCRFGKDWTRDMGKKRYESDPTFRLKRTCSTAYWHKICSADQKLFWQPSFPLWVVIGLGAQMNEFFNILGTLVTSMEGSMAKWPRNRPTTTVQTTFLSLWSLYNFIYILKVKCHCRFNSITEKCSLEFQKAEEEVTRCLIPLRLVRLGGSFWQFQISSDSIYLSRQFFLEIRCSWW